MQASRLDSYLKEKKMLVEEALDRLLPPSDQEPKKLHDSMRYSTMAGGKRLRPILAIAACELCGGCGADILPPACGLELIHTYSLIHDDLPCMDDDDLRRGRPTNHKVYGDAMAVLAGDALLTLAFECFAGRGLQANVRPTVLAAIGHQVAVAAGSAGLVGGQVMDIQQYSKDRQLETLETTCYKKTGCLIEVSLELGALFAGADEARLASLCTYGRKVGLAFQVADDILNVTGDAEKLGKAVRSDAAHDKITFPELLGVEGAAAYGKKLIAEAKSSIASFGDSAWMLRELADFVIERQF